MTILESNFKSTKKGNKRAGQPKGARLAYDDLENKKSAEYEVLVTFWNTGKREEFIYNFSEEKIMTTEGHDFTDTTTTDRGEAHYVAEILSEDDDVSSVRVEKKKEIED